MRRYTLKDGRGSVIGSYDTPAALERFGGLGVIPRADLIDLLEGALDGGEIRHTVSVEAISRTDAHVDVCFTDGSTGRFDVVVGADGARSRVRELLFGHVPDRPTGWACFVWWADATLTPRGETTEWWGAGRFLGTYPCRSQLCVIAGGPIPAFRGSASDRWSGRLHALLEPFGVPVDRLLAGVPEDENQPFLWHMADVRVPRWVDGRVALVGDAAAAFLPTAGVGASMALESAAVLADELSRTDAAHLPTALDLYVKRRRRRVEAAQHQSRWLARVMFVESPTLAHLRDRLMRFVSMERMVRSLLLQLTTPIQRPTDTAVLSVPRRGGRVS